MDIKKILTDFYNSDEYKQDTINRHKKQIESWPWYGKFQHWLFVSWRCPVCKEIRRYKNEVSKNI